MSAEPQLTRSVDDPAGATISIATRLRRAIAVPGRMLASLIVPDRYLPRVVFGERATAAVLALMLCAGVSAWVVGSRIDMTQQVLQQDAMTTRMMGADAEQRSDRDIAEQIAKDRTIAQVKMGLSAGLWVPLQIGLIALGLYLLGRYVGGRPNMARTATAAAYGSLPLGVKSLVVAASAWPHTTLSPTDIEKLQHASQLSAGLVGPLASITTVDAFTLWSVILLGFGLAAAATISRRRAFISIAICFVLLSLLTGGGPPPGPGGHGPMPGRG